MKKITPLLFTLVLLSLNLSAATVLDFNDPPLADGSQDGYGAGSFYYEEGYQMGVYSAPWPGSGSFIRFGQRFDGAIPNNGSVHVGITAATTPYLERSDGNLFELKKIDLGEYSSSSPSWLKDLSFEGVLSDGSTVQQTFTIDQNFDGPGGINDFETFTFTSEWTNLKRVNFLTPGHSFDNVVVAIPEPASASLIALVGGGIYFIRRFFAV